MNNAMPYEAELLPLLESVLPRQRELFNAIFTAGAYGDVEGLEAALCSLEDINLLVTWLDVAGIDRFIASQFTECTLTESMDGTLPTVALVNVEYSIDCDNGSMATEIYELREQDANNIFVASSLFVVTAPVSGTFQVTKSGKVLYLPDTYTSGTFSGTVGFKDIWGRSHQLQFTYIISACVRLPETVSSIVESGTEGEITEP